MYRLYFCFLLFLLLVFNSMCSPVNSTDNTDNTDQEEILYNQPGTYSINKSYLTCDTILGIPLMSNYVIVILESIVVNNDLTMKFNLKWQAHVDETHYVALWPKDDNKDMYIKDIKGNKYEHISYAGGPLDSYIEFNIGGEMSGWFLFPRLNQDSKEMIFYDDTMGKYIDGIVLKK